jgi:glycosyltransferase involved in cell wall biosynthesis
LYQPHDVEGISTGIMELLSNESERRRLGSAACRKVRELFDIAQSADRIKTLFAA